MTEPAVRFEHISKRFPGVQALDDVSFDVAEGSCHALCGENGAGKSTLGKILAGIHAPDGGQLFVARTRACASRHRATRSRPASGWCTRSSRSATTCRVAENLLPRRAAVAARSSSIGARCERRAAAMLAEIGADVDVTAPMGELTIAQQQMVQIAAAVGGGARIIVFDEPTSSLVRRRRSGSIALIGRLKARGVTCIYVSHRMPEIFRLCDTDHRAARRTPRRDAADGELAESRARAADDRPAARRVLAAATRGARRRGAAARRAAVGARASFADVSLLGARRRDRRPRRAGRRRPIGGRAARCSGSSAPTRGSDLRRRQARCAIDESARRDARGHRPRARGPQAAGARARRERAAQHVAADPRPAVARCRFVQRGEERALATSYFAQLARAHAELDVAGGRAVGRQSAEDRAGASGWPRAREILILDEPTRGVDVGAKAEIHALIARARRARERRSC